MKKEILSMILKRNLLRKIWKMMKITMEMILKV